MSLLEAEVLYKAIVQAYVQFIGARRPSCALSPCAALLEDCAVAVGGKAASVLPGNGHSGLNCLPHPVHFLYLSAQPWPGLEAS